MGGGSPSPPKKYGGYVCGASSECHSGICGKTCKIGRSTFKKNPNLDHWNSLGYCKFSNWDARAFACYTDMNGVNYPLLKAEGTIDYNME